MLPRAALKVVRVRIWPAIHPWPKYFFCLFYKRLCIDLREPGFCVRFAGGGNSRRSYSKLVKRHVSNDGRVKHSYIYTRYSKAIQLCSSEKKMRQNRPMP